jgi:hypothetical protein
MNTVYTTRAVADNYKLLKLQQGLFIIPSQNLEKEIQQGQLLKLWGATIEVLAYALYLHT